MSNKLEVKPLSLLEARRGWYPPPPGRGSYVCKCTAGHRSCGKYFEGGKKCAQCADCAYVEVGTIGVITIENFDRGTDEGAEPKVNDMNDGFVKELLAVVHDLQSRGFLNFEIIQNLQDLKNGQAF